ASPGYAYAGPHGSCTYNSPGTYWMVLKVKDNAGLTDVISAYVVVTPPGSAPPPPTNKNPATVTLSNMSQTYTGNLLKPSAQTDPPGLAIVWTNAPQIEPGIYSVIATINEPNYQGSASGIFTVNPAPPTPQSTPPTVSINSPASGNLKIGDVTIQAAATQG